MQIQTLVLGPFQTNAYIIHCEATREAAIIDPAEENRQIIDYLDKNQLNPKYILITHGHLDHIGGTAWLQEKYAIPAWMHEADTAIMKSSPDFAAILGLEPIQQFIPELIKSTSLALGKIRINILHTPGHTPGGVSYLSDGHIFVGDTLFAQGIGRTDLPGGDYTELIETIKKKLFVMNDNVKVYPGHGPPTSIGFEKQYNPFLS